MFFLLECRFDDYSIFRKINKEIELKNYDSFVYSSIETRMLMNIAFITNRLDDEIYPKLRHNLAAFYRRAKDYQKALETSKYRY